MGACDNRCGDLDSASDDIPMVEVTPRRDGKFTVKVSMRDCSSSSGCVYGVDVYRAR